MRGRKPGNLKSALCVLAGIVSVGAVLAVIAMSGEDLEEIRKRCASDIEEVARLSKTDAVKADEKAERTLEEEDYRRVCLSQLKPLERLHRTLHDSATLEREARHDVPPFLRTFEALRGKPAEFLPQRARLRDELKALINKFRPTSFGPRLAAVDEELSRWESIGAKMVPKNPGELPRPEGPWELAIFELLREVTAAVNAVNFPEAERLVSEFSKRYPVDRVPELYRHIQEAREMICRRVEAAFRKLVKEAKELCDENRKGDARSLLEKALPGFKGFRQAGQIDALIQELR